MSDQGPKKGPKYIFHPMPSSISIVNACHLFKRILSSPTSDNKNKIPPMIISGQEKARDIGPECTPAFLRSVSRIEINRIAIEKRIEKLQKFSILNSFLPLVIK